MALATALAVWDVPQIYHDGDQSYLLLAEAATIARNHIFPVDITNRSRPHRDVSPEVLPAFALLKSKARLQELFMDFIDLVHSRFYLVMNDINRFIIALKEEATSVEDGASNHSTMVEMFERLTAWQRAWGYPLHAFEDKRTMSTFTNTFHELLFASLPPSFPHHFRDFLANSLALASAAEGIEGSEYDGASRDRHRRKAPAPSPHLHRLGVLPLYGMTLLNVGHSEILKIAQEAAGEGWEERRLLPARERVIESAVTWITGVYDGQEDGKETLRMVYSRFDWWLCKAFFDIRTDELFDIIVDFPDSLAALEDLRDCMNKVEQKDQLVDKLRAANLKRLLHPGAETKDVIRQYISTIRCLRILDPVGMLLHKVAEPIRQHLRDRPDTIRCIVATLVEGEELQDENDPASTQPLASTNDHTVEKFLDAKWDPEPQDAAPEFRTNSSSDIVGTLVSIYETREVIVNELQAYLATRLLDLDDYDAVKEIRTIELLKIRFGEEALQVCDVMLKDMADSKRINDHVHGDINSVVHPLIISRMFWPEIPASSLRLTPKLEAAQKEYEAAFHHFKPDKHLRFLQEVGKVSVSLELANRVVSVDVTPLQVAVAELFESTPRWSESDLADALGVDSVSIINALTVWASHGVIKEDDGAWVLLEEGDAPGRSQHPPLPPAFTSADGQIDDKAYEYWPYVRGILSSLGPKSLEFIRRTLDKVNSCDISQAQLAVLMAAAKREGRVQQRADGTWVLL